MSLSLFLFSLIINTLFGSATISNLLFLRINFPDKDEILYSIY